MAVPILLIRDRTTKAYAATGISKRGVDQYAVQFFVGSCVNSDGEYSLVPLTNAVRDAMPDAEMIPVESLVKDHAANGEAENIVKENCGRGTRSGATVMYGQQMLNKFPYRCPRGSNQRAWMSHSAMINGTHESMGRIMMTSTSTTSVGRRFQLRMYHRGHQACATVSDASSSPASSAILQVGPVPHMLILRQCDGNIFSCYDSDGSTIFDGYAEDGILGPQRGTSAPHDD